MNLWYILSFPIQPPQIVSHFLLQKSYAPGSPERAALQAAISKMEQELPFEVPVIINGEPVSPRLCMCSWTAIELWYDLDCTGQDGQACQTSDSFGPRTAYLHISRGRWCNCCTSNRRRPGCEGRVGGYAVGRSRGHLSQGCGPR